MNSSFRTTLAVTALTIAGLAHADDTTRATWARVVASQPVYRQVAVAVPRQECQQEIVTPDGKSSVSPAERPGQEFRGHNLGPAAR